MPLFQKSVLNKYLKELDKTAVDEAFKKFVSYFHNPVIQQNIRESKEEQYQEGFLRELFVKVLGYTINPNPDYNLTTEFKNQTGAKKADGAILKDDNAVGVIELKSTKTKDLENVRQQAFDYKANQEHCVYVITSNFEKLRFYINNAVEFEEFNLFNMTPERFSLLYLCLEKGNLLSDIPLKVKEASLLEEANITKQFYKDYTVFKRELFGSLQKHNLGLSLFEGMDEKDVKLLLYKKSQKLIDRFLFIFFAEDRGLLPPNSISMIIKQWEELKELDEYKPLYDRYKKYFGYMNTGFKGKRYEIYAYNGGLFAPDEVLDSLKIDDELLKRHTATFSAYDFDTEVDVNILGHIFENSLNEIEEVTARLSGEEVDKKSSKRKKEGVFYTPKYITKYIVDHTVGKLCEEKKTEIGLVEDEFKAGRQKTTKKRLLNILEEYRKWLLELTICDPACGSGAFLNQALDYLIKEHGYIDELHARLFDSPIVFEDVENRILENNIYGVDINEESVDIARLSLWLLTAKKGRKLTTLNKNIKCGNSLIDDPEVAGDKAFKWEEEFPEVFTEKIKTAYHITTATHDSRTSQRMIDYKVREKRDGGLRPKAEPIWLGQEDELLITKVIAETVEKDGLNLLAYNICGDHMHFILVCEEEEVDKIVGKIKAVSARAYNIEKGITIPSAAAPAATRGHVPLLKQESEGDVPLSKPESEGDVPLSKQEPVEGPEKESKKKSYNSLWTQKFGCKEIKDDNQLWNTVEYINTNREKHGLETNKEMQSIIDDMCCDYDHAFRAEYNGGFDVVIGNPPYVRVQNLDYKIIDWLKKNKKGAHKRLDISILFIVNLLLLSGR